MTVRMKRAWAFLLMAATLLVPTVRAQDVQQFERLTSRTQFYSRPVGTVALLPQVKVAEDAEFAGQWDVLVGSGRYEISQSGPYCFVVNHRAPDRAGKSACVAIGALSLLQAQTDPHRPVSMFRNKGWSRDNDPAFCSANGLLKHSPLTPEAFAKAHDQGRLDENDRLLTHRWHGYHSNGESWADRDVWARAASADVKMAANLAGIPGQPDLRFDAKLLQFAFTRKRNSNRPIVFCVEDDQRIITILTVFSPHFSQATRRFELVFR